MKVFDTGSIIAVCALMTVLFGLIQISVWPIQKDIARLEKRIDKLETGQTEIKALLSKILSQNNAKAKKPQAISDSVSKAGKTGL